MKKFVIMLVVGIGILGFWFYLKAPYFSDPTDMLSKDMNALTEREHVVAEFEYSMGYVAPTDNKNSIGGFSIETTRLYLCPVFVESEGRLLIDKCYMIEATTDDFGTLEQMTENLKAKITYDGQKYGWLASDSDFVPERPMKITFDRYLAKASAEELSCINMNISLLNQLTARFGIPSLGNMTVCRYKMKDDLVLRKIALICGGVFGTAGLLGVIICIIMKKKENREIEKAMEQYRANNMQNAGTGYGTGSNLGGIYTPGGNSSNRQAGSYGQSGNNFGQNGSTYGQAGNYGQNGNDFEIGGTFGSSFVPGGTYGSGAGSSQLKTTNVTTEGSNASASGFGTNIGHATGSGINSGNGAGHDANTDRITASGFGMNLNTGSSGNRQTNGMSNSFGDNAGGTSTGFGMNAGTSTSFEGKPTVTGTASGGVGSAGVGVQGKIDDELPPIKGLSEPTTEERIMAAASEDDDRANMFAAFLNGAGSNSQSDSEKKD